MQNAETNETAAKKLESQIAERIKEVEFLNQLLRKEIAQHKKANALLQKSEANLRTIFDLTDIAFILCDNFLNILCFNSVANNWAEPSFGAPLQEGISLMSLIVDERKEESIALMQNVIKGNSIDFETFYPIQNGSIEWYRVRMNPVYDENRTIVGICISSENITPRKLLEQESFKMTEHIIERNKDLEQFNYIISHNLRAPVANIIGISDELVKNEINKTERQEFAEELVVSIKKLDEIVIDLNFILQVKAEIIEMKKNINLLEILESIKLSIKNIIEKENVQIITDFSEIDEISTLKSYLHSILYNLISNSIKFKHPDRSPVIEIKSEISNNKVKLTFRDNGIGIDLTKNGGEIFGLYKRFHFNVEGKGIGLFMVKTQVDALKGTIKVNSEPNIGTEFVIEI